MTGVTRMNLGPLRKQRRMRVLWRDMGGAKACGSWEKCNSANSREIGAPRRQAAAMTSISTSASFGNLATWTVDLAGGAAVKYFA